LTITSVFSLRRESAGSAIGAAYLIREAAPGQWPKSAQGEINCGSRFKRNAATCGQERRATSCFCLVNSDIFVALLYEISLL
jgi:hypothetical protein